VPSFSYVFFFFFFGDGVIGWRGGEYEHTSNELVRSRCIMKNRLAGRGGDILVVKAPTFLRAIN
jgi:hypothetical protein